LLCAQNMYDAPQHIKHIHRMLALDAL